MSAKTIFVVGAGASFEFKLPVGATLKGIIANIVASDTNNVMDPAFHFQQAIQMLATKEQRSRGPNIWQEFDQAKMAIRHAMPIAYSIDNFLHTHSHSPLIVQTGKLAIVTAILNAEANSSLIASKHNEYGTLPIKVFDSTSSSASWINTLCQRIFMGTTFGNVPDRLKDFSFVSFNYDRCIEHYFSNAVALYYNKTLDEAALALRALNIYHPYGALGPLPWQDPSGLPFGHAANHTQLNAAAERIMTFTESRTAGHDDLEGAQRALLASERIVFLGFGYLPLNMQLLFPNSHDYRGKIYGTAFEMSKSNTNQLAKYFREHLANDPTLDGLTCTKFLMDYERELRLI